MTDNELPLEAVFADLAVGAPGSDSLAEDVRRRAHRRSQRAVVISTMTAVAVLASTGAVIAQQRDPSNVAPAASPSSSSSPAVTPDATVAAETPVQDTAVDVSTMHVIPMPPADPPSVTDAPIPRVLTIINRDDDSKPPLLLAPDLSTYRAIPSKCPPGSVSLSGDGTVLACSGSNAFLLYSVATGAVTTVPAAGVRSGCFALVNHSGSKLFTTCNAGHAARVIDVAPGAVTQMPSGQPAPLWAPDDHLIFEEAQSGQQNRFDTFLSVDVTDGSVSPVHITGAEGVKITGFSLSPDGRTLTGLGTSLDQPETFLAVTAPVSGGPLVRTVAEPQTVPAESLDPNIRPFNQIATSASGALIYMYQPFDGNSSGPLSIYAYSPASDTTALLLRFPAPISPTEGLNLGQPAQDLMNQLID